MDEEHVLYIYYDDNVMGAHECVQTYQIVPLECMWYFACKLYPNKNKIKQKIQCRVLVILNPPWVT